MHAETVVHIAKIAIRDALQSGGAIAGAHLEQDTHVEIV
jgi:hypothetical protein